MKKIVVLTIIICFFQSAERAHAGATEWFDFEITGGHIIIETQLAGRTGYSMIDTGAQMNGINGNALIAQGLSYPTNDKIKVTGVHGSDYRPVYRKIPVTVFGIEINFSDLVDFRLPDPEEHLILGAGFLKLFIFQFDYPNQRMRMITRDSLDLKKLKNVNSKKSPHGGSPLVKVNLNNDAKVWLILDTGASGGILLERSVATRAKWLDRYPAIDASSRGINSSGEMLAFNLPTMNISDIEIENPIILVPKKGEKLAIFEEEVKLGSKIPKSRKAKGLLGYDILKHFVVTIDYQSGHVHLQVP
ncbi:MAG: hypothetical protein HKN70_08430 [Gammaproteobacteria bacterium]|nr:hypothetical protein [Gammaproteobacteria bacterium]